MIDGWIFAADACSVRSGGTLRSAEKMYFRQLDRAGTFLGHESGCVGSRFFGLLRRQGRDRLADVVPGSGVSCLGFWRLAGIGSAAGVSG